MTGAVPAAGAWPDLVCPDDATPLAEDAGALVCATGHRWSITSGIARVLPGGGNYADAFGLQWKTYRRTQLDSHTGLPLSRDRARRCLGEAAWALLERDPPADGWLTIDHYARHLSWYTKTAPVFRMVMKRLPPETALQWSRGLVGFFFPLHRAARNHRVAQALVSRVSPVLSYYHALPLSDDLQRQWALLDTHDSLTDWYKHFRSPSQIRRTLESLGASEIGCAPGGNGVKARCRRPAHGATGC